MADMEVDAPAPAPAPTRSGKGKAKGKDDGKPRFEVKKVRETRFHEDCIQLIVASISPYTHFL